MEGAVIEEKNICIQVNGQVLARFMATPLEQDALALGFLRSEGVIAGPEDVADLRVRPSRACVDVWLTHSAALPDDADAIRTAGCGGGVTFDDLQMRPLVECVRAHDQPQAEHERHGQRRRHRLGRHPLHARRTRLRFLRPPHPLGLRRRSRRLLRNPARMLRRPIHALPRRRLHLMEPRLPQTPRILHLPRRHHHIHLRPRLTLFRRLLRLHSGGVLRV